MGYERSAHWGIEGNGKPHGMIRINPHADDTVP